MNPKEKAKELTDKFYTEQIAIGFHNYDFAKACALICVGKIYKLDLKVGQFLDNFKDKNMYYSYWEEVEEEIKKI